MTYQWFIYFLTLWFTVIFAIAIKEWKEKRNKINIRLEKLEEN